MVEGRAILTMTDWQKVMIHRTVPFSMTSNVFQPRFHGPAIIRRRISQKRYTRQTYL